MKLFRFIKETHISERTSFWNALSASPSNPNTPHLLKIEEGNFKNGVNTVETNIKAIFLHHNFNVQNVHV